MKGLISVKSKVLAYSNIYCPYESVAYKKIKIL